MRSQFLPRLLAWMRAKGGAAHANALIAKYRLEETPGLLAAEMVLPLDVFRDVCECAAELMNEPFVGLEVAADAPRGMYGIVEFAARSAPTATEALDRTIRFLRLFNDIVELKLETTREGSARIVHRIAGEPTCAGRQTNEYVMATLVRIGHELVGAFAPSSIDFAHPKPRDIGRLMRFFGTPSIRFGRGENVITISSDVLRRPVATRDAALLPVLVQHAERILPEVSGLGGPVIGLRDEMQRTLEGRKAVTTQAIAKRLGVSSRSLQRRLEDAGTSFRDELDAVRCALADRYLDQRHLSIGDVACALGFTSQSGFERAFRRWHGVTPGRRRAQRDR
jgi:AraC-like DNA-binding protein